jgi:hypothetical protein
MNSVSEILIAARALIEKPHRWTKDAYATDKNGNPIDPRHEGAKCFCLQGAILRQCDLGTDDGKQLYFQAVTALRALLPRHSTIPGFNDANDHKAVLALLDKAVAA